MKKEKKDIREEFSKRYYKTEVSRKYTLAAALIVATLGVSVLLLVVFLIKPF